MPVLPVCLSLCAFLIIICQMRPQRLLTAGLDLTSFLFLTLTHHHHHLPTTTTTTTFKSNRGGNQTKFSFQLNWSQLVPGDWSGPIIVRSVEYFSHLPALLERHPKRIIHNSLILLFALTTLPPSRPNPITCTKSAIWAMPQVSSALYLTQHPANLTRDNINRVRFSYCNIQVILLIKNASSSFRPASSLKPLKRT